MTTPRKVIEFKTRTSYQESLRKQRDCQQEPSLVMDGLQRIKAWLDAGINPVEACANEANRSCGMIRQEAAVLKECTTPHAAAAFLRKLADQTEQGS